MPSAERVRPAIGVLSGRTVVVARAPEAARAMLAELGGLGASAVAVELQRPAPPVDDGPLREALAELAGAEWLVVTSANGVRAVAPRLTPGALGPDGPDVAVVGPATAAAASAAGWPVDLVPGSATGAALAAAFPPPAGSGRVIAPLAEAAGHDLTTGLTAAGYRVRRVDAYRMAPVDPDPAGRRALATADAVIATAPSVLDRLLAVAADDLTRPDGPVVVCIGPTTAARAAARGLRRVVTATQHHGTGLVSATIAALT
ncbi:MAG: uroporphyrinogen-III synthase [Acidimicrobiales bacterium]